ncbi:uncharacterized protein LOC120704511 isoform X4 [Panicum virgatum]|uniref:Uncharacterized protein n=1 Tax=Panicum virgatum TaxID=38727 RepID=A0A8T0TQD0_PANVG|nr:uncharacterized protein LOC120704511 isoform X4 [Panicum virgatum]KAG2614271.1 hypothetical protein PVAP13_4KG378903 [Panicum virgatum]
MPGRQSRTRPLPSGPPKWCPRVMRDPEPDSAAADRGPPATADDGPRASTQVGSIPLAAADDAPQHRSPSLRNPHRLHQLAAPGPAGRRRTNGAPGPTSPLPSSGVSVTTVPGLRQPAPAATAAAHSHRRTPRTTPSPARADTPSPPPGSRPSSSASSSRMSWTSSGSSARSFADVVKGPANHDPWAKLSSRLLSFLKSEVTCTIYSEMSAYNKGSIISMRDAASFNLKMALKHLCEYDRELAYAIRNCQDRFDEWLSPTLSQFLISEGIVKNAVLITSVTFYKMPDSIKPLSDFLAEHGSLTTIKPIFGGSFELCVAHDNVIMLVHGFLVEIFNSHSEGFTWNGRFSITDMVMVNHTKCRITKMPVRGEYCRAEDLRQFGMIFMQMFSCNREKPLYFVELEKDLCMASEEEVKEEWFREYLLSHPALKRSMTRYHLECGLQHAAKTFGGPGTLIESVLGVSSDWKAIIPTKSTRSTPTNSLYRVFWYNGEHIKDPFQATVGGLLAYKRNYLQHGHEYVKVEDHTELELFAAKTFSQALPNILRRLLKYCNIHMNGPLAVHWDTYRTSTVGNDGNTEERSGICITFCEEGIPTLTAANQDSRSHP